MDSVRERLRSLLMVLLQTLAEGEGAGRPEGRRFRERAAAAGFGPADVDGLLDWLRGRDESGEATVAGGGALAHPAGVRCLAEEESLALTPGAFGYLLELSHRRQISRNQMERLIQLAALVAETPLERREVADLLEQVLFRSRGWSGAPGAAGRAGPH